MEPKSDFLSAIRNRKYGWVYILVIMSFALIAAVVMLGINSRTSEKPINGPTPTFYNFDPGTESSYIPGQSDFRSFELAIGTGKVAEAGRRVAVHYIGYLENGTEFYNSVKRSAPHTFVLGRGEVITGWDIGIPGMRERGKRRLIIPPDLAYRDEGFGNIVPANSTVVFDIELLSVE